jgi:hypothetical protein
MHEINAAAGGKKRSKYEKETSKKIKLGRKFMLFLLSLWRGPNNLSQLLEIRLLQDADTQIKIYYIFKLKNFVDIFFT